MPKSRKKRAMLKQQREVLADQARLAAASAEERKYAHASLIEREYIPEPRKDKRHD